MPLYALARSIEAIEFVPPAAKKEVYARRSVEVADEESEIIKNRMKWYKRKRGMFFTRDCVTSSRVKIGESCWSRACNVTGQPGTHEMEHN